MEYKSSIWAAFMIAFYMGISEAINIKIWFYDLLVFGIIIIMLSLHIETTRRNK